MKQAMLVVNEIQRLKTASEKSKSRYLKNDYSKNISYLLRELKFYCEHKGIDFHKLIKNKF